jgi:type VI secretion system secreted protein VgrG
MRIEAGLSEMLIQKNRQMGIVKSPLEQDVLVAWKLKGHEELGRPFRYQLEMLSEHPEIDFDTMIGRDISVRLDIDNCPVRHFNGFISGFEQEGKVGRLNVYRATLESCAWFLTRRHTCRVFQDKTVMDIFADICGATPEMRYRIQGPGPRTYYPRKYCIQYGESDFQFLSRLFEEEGIYYYFEHDVNGHCMVLCNGDSLHEPFFAKEFDDQNTVHFRKAYNNVRSWKLRGESRPEVYRHRDFDFTVPARAVEAVKQANGPGAEVYEYPGRFSNQVFTYPGAPGDSTTYNEHDAARDMAATRGQELQVLARVVGAETIAARGIHAGSSFSMDDHSRADQNGDYLTVSTDFEIESDDYQGTSPASASGKSVAPAADELKFEFKCRFSAIRADVQFRPARITPRAVAPGPQTATVVGPMRSPSDPSADQPDIYADELGRVKVRFHWDLEQYDDERHSCWIRVAQPWAGSGFGALFTPRVGQEVVVTFLNGDLDRPLIVGSVYNTDNRPPYAPSQEPEKSTLKSRTSGAGSGGNEMRFDDSRGGEQLYLHGEHFSDRIIEDESCDTVGYKRHQRTGLDRREAIGRDHHEAMVRDHRALTIENHVQNVGNDSRELIGNDRHELVANEHIEQIGASRNLTVANADIVKIGPGGKHLTVEGPVAEVLQAGRYQEVSSQYYLAAGQVIIESTSGVSIKTGDNNVVVDSSGVHIKGSKINLNCDANSDPLTGYPIASQMPMEPEPGPDPWRPKSAASDHIVGPELAVETSTRSLNPGSSANFGRVACGDDSVKVLSLYNIGDADLDITEILIDGTNAAEYGASLAPSAAAPLTIPADAGVEMDLTFSPAEIGPRSADLHICYEGPVETDPGGASASAAIQGISYDIGLGGIGAAPVIAVEEPAAPSAFPASLLMPVTPTIEGGPFTKILEVKNAGTALLEVSGISISAAQGMTAAADPTIFKVAPGESREVTLSFECTSTADLTPTLTISSNCLRNPTTTRDLKVSGTCLSVEKGKAHFGYDADGMMCMTGDDPIMPEAGVIDLGGVSTGSFGEEDFTIHNTGSDSVLLSSVMTAGDHPGDFDLSPDLVQAGGELSLKPRLCQDIHVKFTPGGAGPRTAIAVVHTIRVENGRGVDGGNDFATIVLKGEGLVPDISAAREGSSIEPGGTHELGIVTCGSAVQRVLTIGNNGNDELRISAVNPDSQSGQELSCPTKLPFKVQPDKTGNLAIEIDAGDRGAQQGSIELASNDPDYPTFGFAVTYLRTYLRFELGSGTITNRSVKSGAPLEGGDVLDLGEVEAGKDASASLKIINRGSADSNITGISIIGDHDQDFSLGQIPSSSFTIQPGQEQAVTVNFHPMGLGRRAAVVNFALGDYAENTAFSVGLRGTCVLPPESS